MANEKETARILKEALLIVDELSKLDYEDLAPFMDDEMFDFDKLEKLIKKAEKLTKNPLWKLK
jgi:hypothetical protein